jgi:hypothetical protein
MRISRVIVQQAQGSGSACLGPLSVVAPCNPEKGEEPPAACTNGPSKDCKYSEWEEELCSKPCGGGVRHVKRHIETPAANGGKVCDGALERLESCNLQACTNNTGMGPNNDCVWDDWLAWGACDGHTGQQNRIRHIKYFPGPGGKLCEPKDVKQTQSCPRDTRHSFCSWTTWTPWSECDGTCGTGSRRQRKRSLQLTTEAPMPPIPATSELEAKFEALRLNIATRKQNSKQDVVLAFAGGSVSFLLVASVIRVVTRRRNSGDSGPRYSQLESQAPLE